MLTVIKITKMNLLYFVLIEKNDAIRLTTPYTAGRNEDALWEIQRQLTL